MDHMKYASILKTNLRSMDSRLLSRRSSSIDEDYKPVVRYNIRDFGKMESSSFINIIQKSKKREWSNRTMSMSVDWDRAVKKSTQSKKFVSTHTVVDVKAKKTFCTGSRYDGQFDQIGMSGHGTYRLFNGTVYEGYLYDGEYHGYGCLIFPNGSKMFGLFLNGHLVNYENYIFSDEKYSGPYCIPKDRRFYIEILNGIKPGGRSYMTNNAEARKIPNGMYDTVDGFYDPRTKCVYNAKNLNEILRIPTKEEHDWIVKNCRKAWDEPVGFRQNLYDNTVERQAKEHISTSQISEWGLEEDFLSV